MIFIIAWRNIWRHKLRSLTLISSVIIGLWSGIFLLGFYWGMSEERVRNAIENEISHIQVHTPDVKADYDLSHTIPEGNVIIDELSGKDYIKSVTGRLIVKGILSTPYGSSGAKINGVMPDSEKKVTGINTKVVEGGYLNPGDKNSILAGEKLAHKLKFKLGSKVVLMFQDNEGEIISGAFRVKGIYRTLNSSYDEFNIFVNSGDINRLAGTAGDINEIAMIINEPELIESNISDIRGGYPGLDVESWMEIAPEIDLLMNSFDQTVNIFMIIIMLGLAFGIINTMLMAVLERTQELGMLMAVGMNKVKVFIMILLETAMLVFIGCPVGILLSFLTILYFGNTGIDLTLFAEGMKSFGFNSITYPHLEFSHYVRILVFVVVTAFLSSLYPARKALKLNPSEAIRGF